MVGEDLGLVGEFGCRVEVQEVMWKRLGKRWLRDAVPLLQGLQSEPT